MFCPHCGQPVAASATFCGSCGKALVEGVYVERIGYHVGKEIAGIWIRFGSSILDGILVLGISIIVAIFFFSGDSPNTRSNPIGLLYSIVTYSLGTSLGMRATHLTMVNAKGDAPGWRRGTGRAFASILSFLALGLGYFWAIWDRENRTWHDHLAGTWVVKDE